VSPQRTREHRIVEKLGTGAVPPASSTGPIRLDELLAMVADVLRSSGVP
jgi:hypothetical protein